MFANPDAEIANYSKRLFDKVLDIVIGMDGDGTGRGGFVRPDVIRDVLADVAAVVDHNTQVAKTATDRRKFGNAMAKRYETMGKSLAESGATEGWQNATRIRRPACIGASASMKVVAAHLDQVLGIGSVRERR